MSYTSKFPGTGQRVGNTSSRTSTMTERSQLTSTDKNHTGARASHGKIVTMDNYKTNPSASDRDRPLPKTPVQGTADGSADKTTQEDPFNMGFNLTIGEQWGNLNMGNRQRNGGGVYKFVGKDSSKTNETNAQKGAGAGLGTPKTERQKPASKDKPSINLGKFQGNFNLGDDQQNEGGQYEISY